MFFSQIEIPAENEILPEKCNEAIEQKANFKNERSLLGPLVKSISGAILLLQKSISIAIEIA